MVDLALGGCRPAGGGTPGAAVLPADPGRRAARAGGPGPGYRPRPNLRPLGGERDATPRPAWSAESGGRVRRTADPPWRAARPLPTGVPRRALRHGSPTTAAARPRRARAGRALRSALAQTPEDDTVTIHWFLRCAASSTSVTPGSPGTPTTTNCSTNARGAAAPSTGVRQPARACREGLNPDPSSSTDSDKTTNFVPNDEGPRTTCSAT